MRLCMRTGAARSVCVAHTFFDWASTDGLRCNCNLHAQTIAGCAMCIRLASLVRMQFSQHTHNVDDRVGLRQMRSSCTVFIDTNDADYIAICFSLFVFTKAFPMKFEITLSVAPTDT